MICTIFFTVIDSYQKNKQTTTREWEGMGVILPAVERDLSSSFFVGLGRERD